MNAPVRKRLHDRYPELGSGPIPIQPYIDPAYYELEKKYVFKKTWIHVGRVEEIAEPGEFFVRDLVACNASIIVVRDKSGQIGAFHNVCSHRLNKVTTESCGKTKKFFCKFHGWAYDTNGDLTGVPDEGHFDNLNKSNLGLSPVSVDTWKGFVFVNMERKPSVSLADYLNPMFSGLEGYPFHQFTSCFSWQTVVNCNWKMAIDAFQELYHVSFVHGLSIANALQKDEKGNLHPLDGLCGTHHRRLSVAGNPQSVYGNPNAVAKAAPAVDPGSRSGEAGARVIAAAALKLGQGGTKIDLSGNKMPDGMNWTRDPNWAFDINVIFPDFYLSMRPTYYQAYNFRPISHNQTLFDARVYYPESATAGGRFYQEYMKVALRDVLLEDLSTLEDTQSATATGAKSEMIIQDSEIMIRHQYKVVERMIQEGQDADRAAGLGSAAQ